MGKRPQIKVTEWHRRRLYALDAMQQAKDNGDRREARRAWREGIFAGFMEYAWTLRLPIR